MSDIAHLCNYNCNYIYFMVIFLQGRGGIIKKGKKLLFRALMLCIVSMFAFTTYASANDSVNVSPRAYSYFSGSANWYWRTITAPTVKEDNLSTAVVQWTYSSDQNWHKKHFKVVNDAGDFKGSMKFNYLQFADFPTTTKQNYRYCLAISREFIEQLPVFVSGNWEP